MSSTLHLDTVSLANLAARYGAQVHVEGTRIAVDLPGQGIFAEITSLQLAGTVRVGGAAGVALEVQAVTVEPTGVQVSFRVPATKG